MPIPYFFAHTKTVAKYKEIQFVKLSNDNILVRKNKRKFQNYENKIVLRNSKLIIISVLRSQKLNLKKREKTF